MCVCRLWRAKVTPPLWSSCPIWNTETCTATCYTRGWETVLWLVWLQTIKAQSQQHTRVRTYSPTQFNSLMGSGLKVHMSVCQQNRIQRSTWTKLCVTASPHPQLFGSPYSLRSWKHKICVCYVLSTVLLINGWNVSLESRAAIRRKSPKSRVEKREPNQNKIPTECWNIHEFGKHSKSSVEPYSSHRRGLVVSGAGRHSVQADHRSSKRWAVVPSTVQKMNVRCGGCVTKTFFSLCCPAVPPLSNAGKVYDWYCPRDGVPQQQELHPQRPRSSQLHVSTISASAFYSLGSRMCYHLLFPFPFFTLLEEDLKKN